MNEQLWNQIYYREKSVCDVVGAGLRRLQRAQDSGAQVGGSLSHRKAVVLPPVLAAHPRRVNTFFSDIQLA